MHTLGIEKVSLMVRALVLGLVLMAAAPDGAPAAALDVAHRLEIELMPSAHLLTGRDVLQIRVDDRRKLVFALSERADQLRVEVDGKPRTFEFADSQLAIPLEPDEGRRAIEVVITYAASFNDPVPTASLNTDNPGFGVTGSITPTGTFLLAGAGWYPDLVDGRNTFPLLRVKAPEGVLAVTSGLSLGHATRDGFTFSEWRIDNPLRGLALSAAAYVVQEKKVGDVVAATYFLPDHQDLSAAYLDAIAAYLELYAGLFGPYPFPKFAVVENFFPTGYGFSSYTLLGGSLLRLPFILKTSLGHEIAHCWWGNGVFVDYEHGNWSEGLTTYVSDYLYEERESAVAARDYRLQALRNFTTLVPPAKDFPLARFTGRVDTATKAVGYDKGMMVFHMLRKAIGDEAFWGALRDVYRERLFQPTAWDDLRRAFEKRSRRSLAAFFDQWVNRKGAPRIRPGGHPARPSSRRVEGLGPPGAGKAVFPDRIRARPGWRRPARFPPHRALREVRALRSRRGFGAGADRCRPGLRHAAPARPIGDSADGERSEKLFIHPSGRLRNRSRPRAEGGGNTGRRPRPRQLRHPAGSPGRPQPL